MNKDFTPDESARLRATREAFLKKMQAHPEKHQRAIAQVTAARAVGLGDEQVDPFTSALATTTHEIFQLQDKVAEAQAEIDAINQMDLKVYRPRDPQWAGRALARREQLEDQKAHDLARYMGLAEDTHDRAQREAVTLFRQDAAKQQRHAALAEEVKKQTAAAEVAEVRRRAAAVVESQRIANGGDGFGGV